MAASSHVEWGTLLPGPERVPGAHVSMPPQSRGPPLRRLALVHPPGEPGSLAEAAGAEQACLPRRVLTLSGLGRVC